MRILHLVDRVTDRGGAHVHMHAVLESLAGRHELRVAAGTIEAGVELPCPADEVPGLESRTRQPADPGPVVDAFAPDVLHIHTVTNPAVLEWASRHPAVITVQDHRYFCPTRGKWTRDGRVCREPMSAAVCAGCFEDAAYFREVHALTAERLLAVRRLPVVVLSRYMRDELVAAGVPKGRVHVVPPFVNGLDASARPDGPPCVLFVGRLAEAKGVRDAIAAWRLAGTTLPLVFAGTGPLRPEVEAEGFEVLGWLSRPRLSAAYRRARVVLMPPRWQEPFGIVGLEALSLGIPVAAWRSGGMAEWHPGEGLVDWGDVPALARALRDAVGRRARPAAGFDRSLLMEKLLRVYEEVRRSRSDSMST